MATSHPNLLSSGTPKLSLLPRWDESRASLLFSAGPYMQNRIRALIGLDKQQLTHGPYRCRHDGRIIEGCAPQHFLQVCSPRAEPSTMTSRPSTPTTNSPMYAALAMALLMLAHISGSLLPTLALESLLWCSRFLVQTPTFRVF